MFFRLFFIIKTTTINIKNIHIKYLKLLLLKAVKLIYPLIHRYNNKNNVFIYKKDYLI